MRITYDCKLKRPGCVLLQAVFGGDPHLAQQFPIESWLLGPTDDLKTYEVTPEQLSQLVKMAERDYAKSGTR